MTWDRVTWLFSSPHVLCSFLSFQIISRNQKERDRAKKRFVKKATTGSSPLLLSERRENHLVFPRDMHNIPTKSTTSRDPKIRKMRKSVGTTANQSHPKRRLIVIVSQNNTDSLSKTKIFKQNFQHAYFSCDSFSTLGGPCSRCSWVWHLQTPSGQWRFQLARFGPD